MGLPITSFDGYELGSFDETDSQQSDTYKSNIIQRWYGSIIERINKRTEFVTWRDVDFSTLRTGISQRLNSLVTQEEFAKRPGTLSETEYRTMLRASERADINMQTMGVQSILIGGNPSVISAINELSIVTTIDRFAYKAPPEVKLHAGVEYAVWLTRQPGNANRSNALVRSGAASLLEAYRYRGV